MEETRTLHWLPCAIKFTGAAKVGAYFLPTPTGDLSNPQQSDVPMDNILLWSEWIALFQDVICSVASSSGRSVDGKAVQEAYFRGRQLKG